MIPGPIRKMFPPVSRLLFRYLSDRYLSRSLRGDRFQCPVCGGRFDVFLPYGIPPRSNARCPRCGAFERHRLLWLYLKERTDIFSADMSLLDVAPVWYIQRSLRALRQLDYLSIDLDSPVAMKHMDLTNLDLPSDSFDSIICFHVLEHIPDDQKAISELHRVLKPGGWALIQVPVYRSLAKTIEGADITDPAERIRRFGHPDHVRKYGRDYVHRLEKAGFEVTQDRWAMSLSEHDALLYGVNRWEIFYRCSK